MLLALDTSGSTLSVGLFDGEHERASHVEEIGRGHAERLIPTIRAVLDDSDAKPSDLTRIAVVVGPGSFMGLRVGLSAARAMALGLAIEAVGVSRMRALARPHGSVHVVLDARRGEVFEQAFDASNVPVAEMAATAVARFEPGDLPLLGSGAPLVGRDAVSTSDTPSLSDVAALARDHPLPARPVYGRGADAKAQQVPAIFAKRQL